jgi:hypothetical protein
MKEMSSVGWCMCRTDREVGKFGIAWSFGQGQGQGRE